MSAENEASNSIPIFISQAHCEKWTNLACILKCAPARIAAKLISDLWASKHNRTSLIWLPLWALNENDAKREKVGVYFMFSFAVYKMFTSSNCLHVARLLKNVWQCAFFPRSPKATLKLFKLEALADGHAIHINFKRVYFQINFLFLQHLSVQQVAQRRFRL